MAQPLAVAQGMTPRMMAQGIIRASPLLSANQDQLPLVALGV